MNHSPDLPPGALPRVCFIEQGFCHSRRGKPVHGAELFRMDLIRDLAAMGVPTTVPVAPDWTHRIEPLGEAPALRVITRGEVAKVLGTAIRAVLAARRHGPFHTMVFGNPGKGMIPAIRLACASKLAEHYLLFVDRRPPASLLRSLQKLPVRVIANSDFVADDYKRAGLPTRILYGLHRAELFYPRAEPKPEGAPVEFSLVARLPGVCKGLDVALEAFGKLPEGVHERCRLHLISYIEPPEFEDPNIIAHKWMPMESGAELLREMDAHLALSTHETFSHAIVQGMMTALPVIATPIPVYLDKLSPERGGAGGLVVSRVDAVDEVRDAMVRLATDHAERARLGREGREVARERFVWDTRRFVEEYLRVDASERAGLRR